MKKLLVITFGLCLCMSCANAQTWNEWFRQKKTQKKYLIQQIAALKVYLKYLKEGYDVAKKGLGMIGDIKEGNFNDHATYFESLSLVNPSIKQSGKIPLIAQMQQQIMREFNKLDYDCRENGYLTEDELEYVRDVYSNMLTKCEDSISELNTIITDHSAQLKDDERIERIDLIYEDMSDKRDFARSFSNSTRMIMAQLLREKSEVVTQEKLNSLWNN
jgi:hypothetical protein